MKKIDELIQYTKILSDFNIDSEISNGFIDWVYSLLELTLTHRNFNAFGGVFLPQFKKEIALDDSFLNKIYAFNINKEKIYNILQNYWNQNCQINEIQTHDLGENSVGQVYYCLIRNIMYTFESDSGFIIIICKKNDIDEAIAVLNFVSILVTNCLRAKKSNDAISLLSKPMGDIIYKYKSEHLINYACDTCMVALSGYGVAVWLNDNKILKTLHSDFNGAQNIGLDMQIGEGIAGKCIVQNEIIYISNFDLQINNVKHRYVVNQYGLKSGVFIPICPNDTSEGVFAIYSDRQNAFSKLDINIAQSIVQWISIRLAQEKIVKDTKKLKQRIDDSMPLIQSGIYAMERIHDAKNQLSFAQSSLSLVPPDDKYKYIKMYTQDASNYIKNAQRIIAGIADNINIERSKFSKNDLDAIICKTIEIYQKQCDDNKIKVRYNSQGKIHINCDFEQIKRVFQNFFDNSIHYLKSVNRESKTITISLEIDKSEVKINFYDNGTGIEGKDLDKIFDILFTKKIEGLGLGLAIAKRIIEGHDGKISVKSIWGEYTNIIINLPRIYVL